MTQKLSLGPFLRLISHSTLWLLLLLRAIFTHTVCVFYPAKPLLNDLFSDSFYSQGLQVLYFHSTGVFLYFFLFICGFNASIISFLAFSPSVCLPYYYKALLTISIIFLRAFLLLCYAWLCCFTGSWTLKRFVDQGEA